MKETEFLPPSLNSLRVVDVFSYFRFGHKEVLVVRLFTSDYFIYHENCADSLLASIKLFHRISIFIRPHRGYYIKHKGFKWIIVYQENVHKHRLHLLLSTYPIMWEIRHAFSL